MRENQSILQILKDCFVITGKKQQKLECFNRNTVVQILKKIGYC